MRYLIFFALGLQVAQELVEVCVSIVVIGAVIQVYCLNYHYQLHDINLCRGWVLDHNQLINSNACSFQFLHIVNDI